MKKIAVFLLYIIAFLVYTQGFFERFTPFPAKIAIEVSVWILILCSLRLCSFRSRIGLVWMAAILIAGFYASLHTNGVTELLKYIRYLIYSYIIYNVFWSMQFTILEFKRYVIFNVLMILLQGVASIINIFVYGREEYNVGAMSSLGGTTATVFPLFIFSVLLVIFYFFFFTKTKYILLIILMIASVFLMAYSSGKRAIYYYVPVFLAVITIICPFFLQVKLFGRKVLWIGLALVLFIPVYFYGVVRAGGIDDKLVGNESKIEILAAALEFAEDYEELEYDGLTLGRSNTTETVLDEAVASREGWLVGNGFGSAEDEGGKEVAGIGYGFVGYSRDVFSGGIVFASLIALFMVFLILYHNWKPQNPFSTMMRIVALALFVTVHFTYSSDFTVSLKLNMMFAPLLCFINSKNYKHLNEYYISKFQPQ